MLHSFFKLVAFLLNEGSFGVVARDSVIQLVYSSLPSMTAILSAKDGSNSSPGEYFGKRTMSLALRTIGG